MEVPLVLLKRRMAFQPEEGKRIRGRNWVPDEQEVGQAVDKGTELYLGAIAIVRLERVPGEHDESQPAVAGPKL